MRAELLRLASDLSARGRPFTLATVVRREAPTSAQLGDCALITAAGEWHGWLGGACAKATILREARAALTAGLPRLVVLTPDPAGEERPGVRALPMTCHSGGSVEVYLEPHIPPDRLLIFGASETALALARLAEVVGYRVELVDPAADSASSAAARIHGDQHGSGRTFVVVASYGEHEVEAIRRAAELEPSLIALVAGRRRFESIRPQLRAAGVPARVIDAIASPAGLDIGAKTPGEIAVSILAQVVAAARGGAEAAGSDPSSGIEAAAAVETRAADRAAPLDEEAPATDPVCGMAVSGDARPTAEFAGRTFRFCCDACREAFIENPETYVVPA